LHGAAPARFHPGATQLGHTDGPRSLGRSDDRIRNGQAESGADDSIVGAMETVEYGFALIVRNPGSRIVDTQGHTISGAADTDLDSSAVTSEFARVVDKDTGKALDQCM
jgi:hypothetical protein